MVPRAAITAKTGVKATTARTGVKATTVQTTMGNPGVRHSLQRTLVLKIGAKDHAHKVTNQIRINQTHTSQMVLKIGDDSPHNRMVAGDQTATRGTTERVLELRSRTWFALCDSGNEKPHGPLTITFDAVHLKSNKEVVCEFPI